MESHDLEDISLSRKEATESAIMEMCEEYGICVIDSFLDDKTLERVKSEYEEMYDFDKHDGVKSHTKEDYLHALNIDYEDLNTQDFSAIEELVSRPLFENLARGYYAESDVQYPSNLWAAKSVGVPDGPSGKPSDGAPYAHHIDRKNKFKFFFYLSDVGIENGPTYFIPEYHKEYKENRLSWAEENNPRDLPNVIWHYHISNTAEKKEVPVVGDAGTLVIFDTDVPHRAGDQAVGETRDIMRIDTLSPAHSQYNTAQPTASGKIKKGFKNPTMAARHLYDKVFSI